MTKKTTTELAVELANFNFKIENFEDEKMFILSYDWINKDDWRTWKSHKFYGLLKDWKRLSFLIFKAKAELDDKWSLAIFWNKGLLKTAISEWILTEELQ